MFHTKWNILENHGLCYSYEREFHRITLFIIAQGISLPKIQNKKNKYVAIKLPSYQVRDKQHPA